ncbi:MAG: hypothetical protein ACJAYU_004983 [Bradymonadia bacterium]|jgi:hypothetical protein
MNLSRVAPFVFVRILALTALLALGACAELELSDEGVFVPLVESGEFEAYVEEGDQLSQELVNPATKRDIICRSISCRPGHSVSYCFYPPRNPSVSEMCNKIRRVSNTVDVVAPVRMTQDRGR